MACAEGCLWLSAGFTFDARVCRSCAPAPASACTCGANKSPARSIARCSVRLSGHAATCLNPKAAAAAWPPACPHALVPSCSAVVSLWRRYENVLWCGGGARARARCAHRLRGDSSCVFCMVTRRSAAAMAFKCWPRARISQPRGKARSYGLGERWLVP